MEDAMRNEDWEKMRAAKAELEKTFEDDVASRCLARLSIGEGGSNMIGM